MQKVKSNWLDLCALIFFVHFFGALLYAIFVSIFAMRLTGPAGLLSGLELHSWLALVSVTMAVCTVIAESVYRQFLVNLVVKWSFRIWLLALGVMIVWSWVGPAARIQG